MPRILRGLKKRFIVLLFLAFAAVVIIASRQYWLLLLLIAGYCINRKTVQKINHPKNRLTARRKVETIKTLVIGDICSSKVLANYCHSDNSLTITAPLRSLASSALILNHVESVLSPMGTVVIIAPRWKNEEKFSLFDTPFVGLIAAKELGIDRKSFVNKVPLLRHPLRCMLWFMGGGINRKVADCPCKGIIDLCERKRFHLIYLQ